MSSLSSSDAVVNVSVADPVVSDIVPIVIKKTKKRTAREVSVLASVAEESTAADPASVAVAPTDSGSGDAPVKRPRRSRKSIAAESSSGDEPLDGSKSESVIGVAKPRRPVGEHALGILKLWRETCTEVGGNPVLRKSNPLYEKAKELFCVRFSASDQVVSSELPVSTVKSETL